MSEAVAHAVSIRAILYSLGVSSILLFVPTSDRFTADMRFTAAAGLLMALLWLSEAAPLGWTALLPLILFPLAGIQSSEQVAASYGNSAVFLFLGGFLLASTIEKSGLHRRVAYHALRIVGTQPRRLVLAILLTSAVLSMWMSNTATTLMLAPIAVAVVRSMRQEEGSGGVAEAALLAVAYGASLGGLGTPIGTPTNLIFLGAVEELAPEAVPISFAQWLVVGSAYLAITLPVCWLTLIWTSRVGSGRGVAVEELGLETPVGFTRGELMAACLFGATAMLWVFRADMNFGAVTLAGWSRLLPASKLVNDTTVAVAMAALAFLLPVNREGRRLLEWEDFRRVPWDVLILFGGGFALAGALEATGLARWTGDQLGFIGSWHPIAMLLVICGVVTLLSEVASNVATATAVMPVAAAIAFAIGVHPYLLMFSAVFAASSGFMLPVATAPNTIVYATGMIRTRRMARAGFLLDILCAFVITFMTLVILPRVTGINLLRP